MVEQGDTGVEGVPEKVQENIPAFPALWHYDPNVLIKGQHIPKPGRGLGLIGQSVLTAPPGLGREHV